MEMAQEEKKTRKYIKKEKRKRERMGKSGRRRRKTITKKEGSRGRK